MTDTAVAPTRRQFPWSTVLFACLAVLAVLFLAPTVGVILSALKSNRDIAFGRCGPFPGHSICPTSRFR